MKIGDKFIDVQIHPEEHCEDCSEIIHNHIDCPVCKTEYSATDAYCDLNDYFDEYKEIECDYCKTVFKKNSVCWYFENELEIISLEEKYMENSDEN